MYGYESLTRLVYILLVIAFVAVMSYMVWYNLRIKRRTRELEGSANQRYGSTEGIAAGTQAEHQAHLRRKR
jgi:hypothetical protein